jgi:hypothetical protein
MMATSPQDWRITAYQEAKRAIAAFNLANDEPPGPLDSPPLTRAAILQRYRDAAAAAQAALGALVESELRDGADWAELAVILNLRDEWAARAALASARQAGRDRLRERLPYA